MQIKSRVPKSEFHLYVSKLEARGFKKIFVSSNKRSTTYVLERGVEKQTLKFTSNGWLSIY